MSYRIVFLPDAREDFQRWKQTDEKTVLKIKELLQDIAKHPYSGIGKPEPLKHNLTGKWSRRINKTDRIIYSVNGTEIIVYVFSVSLPRMNSWVSLRSYHDKIDASTI